MDASTQETQLPLLGYLLCIAFAILAALTTPAWVERWIPLEWQVGDVRPVLQALQVLFLVAAVTSFFLRRRLAARAPSSRRVGIPWIASVTVLATLGLGELVLRLLHLPFAEKWAHLEMRMSRFDEELGWEYRPHQSLMQGEVPVHFDSVGARVPSEGYEHDSEKPAVLFIGGSFTFGHGLPYEESFVGRLAQRDDQPYEFVNLGVQAYGTDQSLLRLERYIGRYNAKLVVYTFVSAHIQRNANEDRRLLYPQARFLGTKPRFAIGSEGQLQLEHRPTLYEELSYSRLWAYARMAWIRMGPPYTAELTRALIQRMRDVCQANGAEFLVLNWVQDTPMSALFLDLDVFGGLGVPVLDTSEGAPEDWNEWKIPKDGHPDARAHARAAELLAEWLGSHAE